MNSDVRQHANCSVVSIAFLVGSLVISGCREGSATPNSQPQSRQTAEHADIPDVLATVGGEKVTMADVRSRWGEQLDQLETQYQLAKNKIVGSALDTILREKTVVAEAQKSGKSVDVLIAAEAGPSGLTATDADVENWYKANPDRVGGRTLDQVRPQIAAYLANERRRTAEKKLEDRIRAERKVTVSYEPFRLKLNNEHAPTAGKSGAPVTLVEFSDFQCPYCKGMAPTLKQVEQKLGNQVQIVYRQYPLTSIHPFAFKAAEASLCANEQGKFWELHDLMFQEQSKLAVSDLKEKARRLGMDGKKFDGCLDSGRYVEQVQNDQKEGLRVGVSGTPALFVNGRPIEGGAVPYAVLEAAIQMELDHPKP
jgi:protein-disulfide isomerase